MSYHSERVKKYHKIRSRRVIRKRHKAEKKRQKYNKWLRKRSKTGIDVYKHERQTPSKHYINHLAPENFSLRSNVDIVVAFFAKLIKALEEGDSIKIDLSHVKNISSDVILYLLSILDMFKQKKGVWRVKGNAPRDPKCRELFIESGFYNYVNSKMPPSFDNRNFLSVKGGTFGMLVDGKFAEKVIDFSVQCLNTTKSLITKKIYAILIACMANTREHAYTVDDYNRRWWATALYDENNKKVNFTFLDNGMGIPETVKKNVWEKFLRESDNKLITSALRGELRTRTGDPWRGKGLPSINEYYQKGIIKNLVIISNRGYVNHENQEERDLNDIFHGTLLSWDFIEQTQ